MPPPPIKKTRLRVLTVAHFGGMLTRDKWLFALMLHCELFVFSNSIRKQLFKRMVKNLKFCSKARKFKKKANVKVSQVSKNFLFWFRHKEISL
jgi:hypothetical protein